MSGTTNTPEVSVIIRKGDAILFVLREKTGYADGFYALPGGHVEHAEPFSTAAIREVLEEVNVTVKASDLKPVLSMQRIQQDSRGIDVRVGLFFEALKWSGTPKNMEPERHSKLAWFKSSALPFDTIMAFQAAGLRAIERGDMYHELGWDEQSIINNGRIL